MKKSSKKQLFRGYILQPWSIVAPYCIVLFLFFVVAVAITVVTYNDYKNQPLLSSEEVFLSCNAENRSLILTSETGQVFTMTRTTVSDEEAINEFVRKGDSLFVYYNIRFRTEPASYDIKAIFDRDGLPVVSTSSITNAETKSIVLGLSVVWGIFIVFLGFGIGAFKVLSNAPIHPHLVRFLIRREFRNY